MQRYDLSGKWNYLVMRGGFGIYRWQFSEGDVDGSLNPSLNVQSIITPSTTSIAQLATFAPAASTSWCALNATCPMAKDVASAQRRG